MDYLENGEDLVDDRQWRKDRRKQRIKNKRRDNRRNEYDKIERKKNRVYNDEDYNDILNEE